MPIVEFVVIAVGIIILALLRFARGGVATVAAGTDISRKVMAIIVSLVVLASSLWVVLSGKYGDAPQKWGFGAIGTILGFWLRSEK
jgi:hypothetical protein